MDDHDDDDHDAHKRPHHGGHHHYHGEPVVARYEFHEMKEVYEVHIKMLQATV